MCASSRDGQVMFPPTLSLLPHITTFSSSLQFLIFSCFLFSWDKISLFKKGHITVFPTHPFLIHRRWSSQTLWCHLCEYGNRQQEGMYHSFRSSTWGQSRCSYFCRSNNCSVRWSGKVAAHLVTFLLPPLLLPPPPPFYFSFSLSLLLR